MSITYKQFKLFPAPVPASDSKRRVTDARLAHDHGGRVSFRRYKALHAWRKKAMAEFRKAA